MNSNNIIRKLGTIETYFQNEIEIGSSINVSTILFETSIDLFKNIELVNKAVDLWKQTQPLLRSKIFINDDRIGCDKENNLELGKYFVYADDSVVKNMNNVKYLYFKLNGSSNLHDDCKDYWKLLVEHEMTIPIDWQNGLMWRLIFLNMNQIESADSKPESFKYSLLISVTHAIFDGASAFFTLNNLFHLIERLFTNTLDVDRHINDATIVKSVEEHAKEFIDLNNIKSQRVVVDRFKQPKQFLLDDDLTDRQIYYPIENLDEYEIANGFFRFADRNNDVYIGLTDLLKFSEKSVTKFHFATFDDDKYKKFLALCKSKNAKLTGVFNLIFILAWRYVYKHFKVDKTNLMKELDNLDLKEADYNHQINYLILVNLRTFLRHVDFSSLVWLCNNLHSTFEHELNENESDFWEEKFWQMARMESDLFHSRLKTGEQFKFNDGQSTALSTTISEDMEKYLNESTLIHYGLSNLQVPFQITKINKLINIKQMFTLTSYRQDWKHDFSYNNIISLGSDECMFWSLSYNSYFLKRETIEVFINKTFEIYNKIISSSSSSSL